MEADTRVAARAQACAGRFIGARSLLRRVFGVLGACGVPGAAFADVLCVDAAAAPGGTGACWTQPFHRLDAALAEAAARGGSHEIWVRSGTYVPPPVAVGATGHRSFRLVDGVAVYGGFTGTETLRAQRNPDPATNGTVLSGDVNGDDGPGFAGRDDNANHVVLMSVVGGSAVLDGFVVRGGSAMNPGNSSFPLDFSGGGVRVDRGSLTVRNVRFVDNQAALAGGGAAVLLLQGVADAARFVNCEFVGNRVAFGGEAFGGGGLYLQSTSRSAVTHSRFLGNRCLGDGCSGGGLMVDAASVPTTLVSNSVFSGNLATAASSGSGLPPGYGGGGGLWVGGLGADVVGSVFRDNVVASPVETAQSITAAFGTLNLRNSIVDRNIARPLAATINYRNNLVRGCADPLPPIGAGLPANCPGNDLGRNFRDDPRFVDPLGPDGVAGTLDDDLRLAAGSPAIDSGDNAVIGTDVTDVDGNGITNEVVPRDLAGVPRRLDVHGQPDAVPGAAPEVDLGAYEAAGATIALLGATQLVVEGVPSAVVRVRVTTPDGAALDSPVSVVARTVPGTAQELSNFIPVVQTLTFPPGTASGVTLEVGVQIVDNVVAQPPVRFDLALGTAGNAVLGAPRAQTISIVDNDGLSVLDASAVSGQVLQFPLQLPAPAITPTLVSYRLVAGTATPGVDYDPSTQDVLLPVGASAAAISVDTYPFFDGPPRQFRVELLSASGLVLAADSATGTLTSRPSTVFADGFE